MKIRPARTKDKRAIGALVGRYPKELSQGDVPPLRDFFVAEIDGRVVGCCALEVYSKKIAEIRSLAVEKDSQGKGVGARLVKACVAKAKKKKVRQVLAITGAASFFNAQGFKPFNAEKYALFKVFS